MPFLSTIGGGSAGASGFARGNLAYLLARSLRFRNAITGSPSSPAYLSRTFSSGDQQKWTFSVWMKKTLGRQTVFGRGSTQFGALQFDPGDTLSLNFAVGGTTYAAQTSQVFRDPAAWYHIVWSVDTTQATGSNRQKLYVNGTQVTAWASYTDIPINSNGNMNTANSHWIGRFWESSFEFPFSGYMTEINFIDGQQLAASSFGKTDSATNTWVPKKYGGSYGTNGFYLNFSDNSGVTATTLGKDSSGNGNNWTPNNMSVTSGVTYDSMTDVPTLTSATAANYCTLNPLTTTGGTFSNGNLVFNGGGAWRSTNGTLAIPTSGQWYFEATLTNEPAGPRGSNTSYNWIGVGLATNFDSTSAPSNTNVNGFLWGDNGYLNNFSSSSTDSTVSLSSGDVMRLGIDTTNNTYTLYKNAGLVASSTFNVTAGTQLIPYHFSYSTGYGAMAINFGQRPFAYPTTSGAFSGYKALNTYNLS